MNSGTGRDRDTDSPRTSDTAATLDDYGRRPAFLVRLLAVGWVPLVVLAIFAGTYTVAAQHRISDAYSPFDEYQYYDYLTKVPSVGFVRQGDEVGEQARRVASCDGYLFFGVVGATCDGPQEPDGAFFIRGLNSADIYTPAYFAVTWVLAQPFTWLGMDLQHAGRAVGGVWLFAGLAAIFLLMKRLGVHPAVALGVCLALLALPATFWATQYISTDAPTYLVVALVGLAGVRLAAGVGRGWELPAAAALAVVMKINNAGGVALTLLALVTYVHLRRRHRESGSGHGAAGNEPGIGRTWRIAILTGLSVVVAYGGWLVVRAATVSGTVDGVDLDVNTRLPFRIGHLVDEAVRFAPMVGGVALPGDPEVGVWVRFAETLFPLLGLGALAVALVASGPLWQARRAIGIGVLGALVTFGPVLTLLTVAVSGSYVPLAGRYGIVFVPAFALLLALVGHQVRVRGTWVAGAGALAAGLTLVLGTS